MRVVGGVGVQFSGTGGARFGVVQSVNRGLAVGGGVERLDSRGNRARGAKLSHTNSLFLSIWWLSYIVFGVCVFVVSFP